MEAFVEKIRVTAGALRSSFPALLFCLFTLLPGCGGTGKVQFSNHTGEAIVEGHLRVGGRVFDLGEIKPGEGRSFSFPCSDCHTCDYVVGVTLSSGRRAVATIGTLRRGMDYEDLISLEKKRILLESHQSEVGNSRGRSILTQEKPLKWIL